MRVIPLSWHPTKTNPSANPVRSVWARWIVPVAFWAAGWPVVGADLSTNANVEPAQTVVSRAIQGSTVPYTGDLTITRWSEHGSHSEEVRVFVGGRGSYRYEFLTPSGKVGRVVAAHAGTEYVLLPGGKKILRGEQGPTGGKPLPSDRARALLLSNYRVLNRDEDDVAGRAVWSVELVPYADGKPRQQVWLDKETGVILALRRYGPSSRDAASMRFSRFEPDALFEDNFFQIDQDTHSVVRDHDVRSADLPLSALSQGGRTYPAELPFGFVFTGGARFQLGGETVTHLTYTDGLSTVSLFETPRPVNGNPPSHDDSFPDFWAAVSAHFPTRVVHGRKGRSYYTLIGEGSESLLRALWSDNAASPSTAP